MTRSGPATPSTSSAGTEHPPGARRGDAAVAPARPPCSSSTWRWAMYALRALLAPVPAPRRGPHPSCTHLPMAPAMGGRRVVPRPPCPCLAAMSQLSHRIPARTVTPRPSLPCPPVAVSVARKESGRGGRKVLSRNGARVHPAPAPLHAQEAADGSVRVGCFKKPPI